VVATGAVVSIAMRGGADKNPAGGPPDPDGQVRDLFGDLGAGGALDKWKIEQVHGVYFGAIPVVMSTAGGTKFQVDVLRRDAAGPDGVGNTDSLSLFVANKGNGADKTDEDQGLGAIALAQALAAREQSGAAIPGELVTLKQRHEKFPDGGYSVL